MAGVQGIKARPPTVVPAGTLSVTTEISGKPATRPETTTQPSSPTTDTRPKEDHAFLTFHDVLSAMNPLQYVPVIGTVYRSATGDVIPEHTRLIGSFLFSGLTSGPIGLATSAAAYALEKITGVDPEKVGHSLLARIGIGHDDPDPSPMVAQASEPTKQALPRTAAAAAPALVASKTTTATDSPVAHGLSPRQLAAYGVRVLPNGDLRKGNVQGADVLNELQLSWLEKTNNVPTANTAYRNTTGKPPRLSLHG